MSRRLKLLSAMDPGGFGSVHYWAGAIGCGPVVTQRELHDLIEDGAVESAVLHQQVQYRRTLASYRRSFVSGVETTPDRSPQ